jgi:hypothetical protein
VALSGEQHVLSGGFARSIPKSPAAAPQEQRSDFSTQEKSLTVFLTWSPQDNLKGQARLRIHDADNRVVADSKPKKTTLRRGGLSLVSWQIPMFAATGVYRAEVLLDDKPVWRGFVRITG